MSGSGNDKKQNWAASPSTVFNHFATSGLSVAVATAITHPLGALLLYVSLPITFCQGLIGYYFWFSKLCFCLFHLHCLVESIKCCDPVLCILAN